MMYAKKYRILCTKYDTYRKNTKIGGKQGKMEEKVRKNKKNFGLLQFPQGKGVVFERSFF